MRKCNGTKEFLAHPSHAKVVKPATTPLVTVLAIKLPLSTVREVRTVQYSVCAKRGKMCT